MSIAQEDRFPSQYVDDIEVRVSGSNRYGIGRTAAARAP